MECHDLHGCLQVKWCGPDTELSDYQTMQKYQSTEGPPQLHDRVEGSFSQLFVYPVQANLYIYRPPQSATVKHLIMF